MISWFRLAATVVCLLLAFLASAQEVRPGDLRSLGRVRRQFEKAAEKAEYHGWPHVREGDPGTIVCVVFDVSNLDAILITSKSFPISRLTDEGKTILRHMDRTRAEVLTLPGDLTMGVDLEFNPYIVRHQYSRNLDLDLARLGAALRASNLPKPIYVGVEFEKGMDTTLRIGSKRVEKDKFAFFKVDDLVAGSSLRSEARATWWALVAVVFGGALFALVVWVSNLSWKTPAVVPEEIVPEPQPTQDPETVQQAYDRSRPAFLYLLPMMAPMVLCGLADFHSAVTSLEILSPLPLTYLMGVYFATLFACFFASYLGVRRRRRREAKPQATVQSLTLLTAMMVPTVVLASGMMLLLAIPAYTPEQMAWRRYVMFGLVGLTVLSFFGIFFWTRKKRVPPERIVEGPIYDTTMEFARIAGVKVRAIEIQEIESINASASLSSVVGVTRGLLEKMEPDEIRAVLAHEVGHLAYRHVARNIAITLPLTFGLYYGWSRLADWLEPTVGLQIHAILSSTILPFFILNGAIALAVGPYRRRLERDADAFAVRTLGDEELVIRTLVKLHTLNESSHRLKPLDEAMASHPSLVNRIAAIRSRAA